MISSTADDVERALGKALDRLDAPVFGMPCSVTALEAFLTLARVRIGPAPPLEVTTR